MPVANRASAAETTELEYEKSGALASLIDRISCAPRLKSRASLVIAFCFVIGSGSELEWNEHG